MHSNSEAGREACQGRGADRDFCAGAFGKNFIEAASSFGDFKKSALRSVGERHEDVSGTNRRCGVASDPVVAIFREYLQRFEIRKRTPR